MLLRKLNAFARAGLIAVATVTACASLHAQPASMPASPKLPVAAIKPVTDMHHGTAVVDPYRYFENIKDKEVAAWMKAHSDHAHSSLARIEGRSKVLASIQKYEDAASSRVVGVSRAPNGRVFYQRRGASENQFKLYVKDDGGTERILVDPELWQKRTGKPHAINYFTPSPDGRYVAYGLSKAGSEDAVLHIIDTQTVKAIGKPIERAQFGGVDWTPDSKGLHFNRLQALAKGAKQIEKFQRSQMHYLALGAAAPRAKPVFGMNQAGVKMTPAEIPFMGLSADGKWAFGFVVNGVQREQAAYFAPQADVLAGKANWTRVVDYSDEITGMVYNKDTLFMKSHKGASRSKVLAMSMLKPGMANAVEIVPAGERVVTNIGAAKDALYVEMRDGNTKRLFKRAYTAQLGDAAPLIEVKLPIEGAFDLNQDEGGSGVDSRFDGAVIDLQSWTRARQIYEIKADASVVNTQLQPKGPFDEPQDIVATEVKVPSHDGALVPLSIIHKKGLVLDGSNPTILYGYASYGISEEPFFSNGRLAWIEQGGIFAVANPRGSSVYGQDWYKGGFQATKPNTWKDFIAVAEYLIASKYTSSAKLGILGGSAGGILVGRAMTDRPDLFAVVVPAVGALDTVRQESTPNGIPNIPEFGTVKTEAGFKGLLEMSTYAKIKDATAYPAVLLTHGVNDPRVEVWKSTKAAARLMAASTSGKPIFMRLDYDAGHGIGNTKKQSQNERADIYSFMLWQMGVAGFGLK